MLGEGHQVFVMIGGDGPVVNNFREAGLNVIQIPSLSRNISPFKDVMAYFEIKKALRFVQPDIVSTHSSKAGFLGRFAARRLNIPVLFTAHGWSFTTGKSFIKQSFYKTLERIAAPVTDIIITVSDYDKKLALEKLSVPEEKVLTIHNGMYDIDGKYRAYPAGGNPVNLVMIARFDKQKDHIELLTAIRNINNLQLHFVGDGPLMDDVKKFADELGITKRITFWGRVNSVDSILAKCHIFALISNWEGFPRSTLEAMRAGIPTIVTDVGGAAEAVIEDETGYVVGKGDIAKLNEVVKKLVTDAEKRMRMGKAARENFEKYFTFEIMYAKTLSVFREVLKEQSHKKKQDL